MAIMQCTRCDGRGDEMTHDTGICGTEEWGTCRLCRGTKILPYEFEALHNKIAELEKKVSKLTRQTSSLEHPPIKYGTKVVTYKANPAIKDWTKDALLSRQWGINGDVIMHHDSHGLCYEVKHEDGTVGHYDPSELRILTRFGE